MKRKLIEVLSIQSESYNDKFMVGYLLNYMYSNNIDCFVDDGNIYITKGEADYYPCIVAHMDTVHKIVEDLTVIEIDGKLTGFNKVRMEQTGIGGDDKVGIFIALQCLEKFENIKVVFFRDEEVGCDGSYNANIKFFANCAYILQCDRQRNNDFIIDASGVKLSGKDFQDDILPTLKQFGYKFNKGMMTDVMALKELGIVCAMANISCGYYNPHFENEYVVVADVMNCMEMVFKIIETLRYTPYTCPYKKPTYKYKKTKSKYGKKIGFYDNSLALRDFTNSVGASSSLKKDSRCECCDEDAATEYVPDYNMDMCERCIKAYIKPYGV